MVKQSKKKDPRFWRNWKKSGALGTMEDSWRRKFPQWNRFEMLLRNVKAGYLHLEDSARDMVEEYGLPVTQLDSALKVGIEAKL